DGESNNFCLLHCLSEGARERRKAKSKEEGARRAVDRRPVPAPAATPNTQPQSPPWQWRRASDRRRVHSNGRNSIEALIVPPFTLSNRVASDVTGFVQPFEKARKDSLQR